MIQINLIPDVKMELLKARKMRTMVTSVAILVAIAAGAVVVVLAMYVFGAQSLMKIQTGNAINTEYEQLSAVEDLSKTLTIQNQLREISTLHGDKMRSSRLFDILTTTVPTGKNAISINQLTLDRDNNTILVEGMAENGYEALEVFKKTLADTKFEYSTNGEKQEPINIATAISQGDSRRGQDDVGKQVLRFSLSFEYPDELFSASSQQGRIIAPDKQNATDSNVGVPKSLFGQGSE